MGARPTRVVLALALLALRCAPATSASAPAGVATRAGDDAAASLTLAPAPRGPLEARLPLLGGALAPSQTVVDGVTSGDVVTETGSCAGCHADAAAQWAASAHAFASFNNPIYRAAVDRFRKVVGNDASRFCAGCHDVALLVDGAMSGDVAPTDPRARGGVTCRVCHGVERATPDGNGSYALASSPVPIPREGDDASLAAHKARMALPPLRTAALCGACHRSFLSPETGNAAHLVGQDELGAWRRSAYAGSLAARIDEPIEEAECRTCHMPLDDARLGDAAAKDGKLRSHRFAGGQTWLAAMRHDATQLAAEQARLRGAASVDIAAATSAHGARTLPADGAPAPPGEAVTLDVVVRNEHAGHRFPAGVLDAQDTWIELRVTDARGREIAESGTAGGDDAERHVLRALQADARGTPVVQRETDRFSTPVFNHTIPPRDAEVVRYRVEIPRTTPAAAYPLRAEARLRHRSRNASLARETCAEGKTPRGAAFVKYGTPPETGAAPIDPCAAPPITEIASATVWLGGPRPPGAPPELPAWRRLYDHALGLSHALQEDLDAARASLDRAIGALSDAPDAGPTARAMILQLAADIAVRQGRTREALDELDEAERLAPGHPAIARTRADALGAVWRWREAMAPMEQAARAAPLDDTLWARLAIACGSSGDATAALAAADHGLALAPRDADLLRVQALALESLDADPALADRARAAFARWRPPDDAPATKNLCAARFTWCGLERVPVHVHTARNGT